MTLADFSLYSILSIICYLFCLSILYFYYITSDDVDSAKICRDLMWLTPLVPALFPIATVLGVIGAFFWFLLFYLPDLGDKNKAKKDNFFEDEYRKRKESEKKEVTDSSKPDIIIIKGKTNQDKLIEPIEPVLKPKNGEKISFKKAFKYGDNNSK